MDVLVYPFSIAIGIIAMILMALAFIGFLICVCYSCGGISGGGVTGFSGGSHRWHHSDPVHNVHYSTNGGYYGDGTFEGGNFGGGDSGGGELGGSDGGLPSGGDGGGGCEARAPKLAKIWTA